MRMPNIDEKWTHFKGGKYVILGFAWCAVGSTLQLRIRYRKLAQQHDTPMGPEFSRTLDNFLEPVDHCPRFERAGT